MPGYREERMQEDTVGNSPFSYTASETCNEDARKDRCRGQRESWPYNAQSAFHGNNKTMCHQFNMIITLT